jgi:hypothetical protein
MKTSLSSCRGAGPSGLDGDDACKMKLDEFCFHRWHSWCADQSLKPYLESPSARAPKRLPSGDSCDWVDTISVFAQLQLLSTIHQCICEVSAVYVSSCQIRRREHCPLQDCVAQCSIHNHGPVPEHVRSVRAREVRVRCHSLDEVAAIELAVDKFATPAPLAHMMLHTSWMDDFRSRI